MTELNLIYNPYRAKTVLSVKNSLDEYEPVNKASKLNWISDRRLQRWVNRSEHSFWKGFFVELFETSGDNEFKIHFVGTKDDLLDLSTAAQEFENLSHSKIILINESGNTQSALTGRAKLSKLNQNILKAKQSSFYNILPADLRKYLNEGFVSKDPDILFFDVNSLNDRVMKDVFKDDAWSCVYFCYELLSIDDEKVKSQVSSIVYQLLSIKNIEEERERFSFVFFYNDEDDISLSDIYNREKKFFLKLGIPDISCYSVPLQYKNNLMKGVFVDKNDDAEIAKIAANIELYKKRYAEQIRLQKSCNVIKAYIEKYELNKSSLRRKINIHVEDNIQKADTENEVLMTDDELLSRLYEQITNRYYEEELNDCVRDIKTNFRKEVVKKIENIVYPQYCISKQQEKFIEYDNIDRFVIWCKNEIKDILQIGCKFAYEKIEVRWLRVFYESFDEYINSVPRDSSKWIPDSFGKNIKLESPISQITDTSIPYENINSATSIEYIDKKKICKAKDILMIYISLSEQLFEKWIESYKNLLLNEVNSFVKDMNQKILSFSSKNNSNEKDLRYVYRDRMENEAKIKEEAINWINSFIDTINHLLDVRKLEKE